MSAPEFDWEMYRNDDMDFVVSVVDNAGTVVPLTGATEITFSMAKKRSTGFSSTAALTKKFSNGVSDIEITDDEGGICVVHIASDDTENLSPGEYYYEVEVIDIFGKVGTVLVGTLTLLKDLVLNP